MRILRNATWVVPIMLALVAAVGGFAHADTNVNGAITTDTVWTLANSPYLVNGTVAVIGANLTIEPGVLVNFDNGQNLSLDSNSTVTVGPGCRLAMQGNSVQVLGGIFKADGTPEHPVVIDRRIPTSGWNSVYFSNANSQSLLDYCRISGTTSYLIYIVNAAATNPITITNCYLESLEGAAQMVRIENGNPVIANNVMVYGVAGGSAVHSLVTAPYYLYPNLSMNAIVRPSTVRSGQGIYFEFYNSANIVVAKNRVKGFTYGVYFHDPGNDTGGNHVTLVEDCILDENDTSVRYRVGNYADVTYNTRNNWLRRAEVVWGGSCVINACASDEDYWTWPFPDRSNLTSTTLICTNERTSPPFPEGDVDDDGDTDRDDAALVGEYLVGNKTIGELPNADDADADGNDVIDARDMALIRAFAEGMIWKLPREE